MSRTGVRYAARDAVDFVVVGSGAAGGVVARELSMAGFRVVVLEQGPWLHPEDFRHDELGVSRLCALTNNPRRQPNTFRATDADTATVMESAQYGQVVGGGTVHFTGNYWRFHEVDFIERSLKGPIAGTGFDDWPITYADLEPYYSKVEWEIGVSGLAGANPFDPPRTRPYPMPPLPIKSTGVLAERAARAMGWHAFPSPMAIASEPHRGRAACVQCGFCESFGCEMGAKSSTLATMIPEAVRTGRCEIRPDSYVRRIETDGRGRVVGVKYFDAKRREVFQRARAVVLCANGAETPRLLLLSASAQFPQGLANGSGMVGRHLMFNGSAFAGGRFDQRVNGYRGTVDTRVIQDLYELDPALGLVGGGGFDFRFDTQPIAFALWGLTGSGAQWGGEFKRKLRDYFNRTAYVLAHTSSLPVPTNTITLDPTVKDDWGLAALRMTFQIHPNDQRLSEYFLARVMELLQAAGATDRWAFPAGPGPFPQVHLLGTCRMGNDPRTSVVDRMHRAHDVPNLFIVDGSSFVTSGRGQPTMTIQALAFRAAENMARMAKAGGLGQ